MLHHAYLAVEGLNSLSSPVESLGWVFDGFHQYFLPNLGISPNNVTGKKKKKNTPIQVKSSSTLRVVLNTVHSNIWVFKSI